MKTEIAVEFTATDSSGGKHYVVAMARRLPPKNGWGVPEIDAAGARRAALAELRTRGVVGPIDLGVPGPISGG